MTWRPAPQELRDEFDIDMRVLGIISSERMLLSDTAIDLGHWRERFERCAAPHARAAQRSPYGAQMRVGVCAVEEGVDSRGSSHGVADDAQRPEASAAHDTHAHKAAARRDTPASSRCRDAQPADMDAFAAHLAGNYVPNTVIVDATASSALPERYMAWMQAGALRSANGVFTIYPIHSLAAEGLPRGALCGSRPARCAP